MNIYINKYNLYSNGSNNLIYYSLLFYQYINIYIMVNKFTSSLPGLPTSLTEVTENNNFLYIMICILVIIIICSSCVSSLWAAWTMYQNQNQNQR